MLNIYTDKSFIEKDKFINDNEDYFKKVGFYDRNIVEPILNKIEQGKWVDATKFQDRFGVVLYSDFVSTGTKTLINISGTDLTVNGCEMGLNAIQYMLLHLNGNVYLKPIYQFEVGTPINVARIRVNNKEVKDSTELEELLCL